jgi:hypothetical protein
MKRVGLATGLASALVTALAMASSLAACTDPVIEMSLALPDAAAAQGFDLSCVGAVSVTILGNDMGDTNHPPDAFGDCVDLAAPPKTFADVQQAISGRFSFSLPRSGLAGVQLSGVKGSCGDLVATRESVFYGGAPRAGGDRMTIPLVPNISCDKAHTYGVTVIDLMSLAMNHSCDSPIDTSRVFAGDIRPRLMGDQMPRMMLERGASEVLALFGSGTVASYSAAADAHACIAVGYDGSLNGGAQCVNPAAQTLCADTGQLETASLPLSYIDMSREADLIAQYGEPVFGGVWEPTNTDTEIAIANATVELADPTQGKVFYVQRGAAQFTRIDGALGTNAEGWFVAYIHGEPIDLIVKAAGHAQQTIRVAATPDWPSTVIAALPHL